MNVIESLDYFESYEDLKIHQLMLSDTERNTCYQRAISDNKESFFGKTVLDIGAGTGILSIFCAQAGAKKVYAVEASAVYKIAQEIVKENSFQNIIEVINSKVEDFKLPDDEKVDVIVSEWMGFYLLHEGMLDSVIFARDNFLKPNGLIFPETATIYTAPCSVPSFYDDWDEVNGISMKHFASSLRRQSLKKPETILISPEHILSQPEIISWLDLKEVTKSDLDEIKTEILVVANKSDKFQGICIWFTCSFPSTKTEPVILSTDPDDPPTHWKQTVIVLPDEAIVEEKEPIAYEICLKRVKECHRRYNIELTLCDPEDVEHPEYCFCFFTKCILQRALIDKYENEINMES